MAEKNQWENISKPPITVPVTQDILKNIIVIFLTVEFLLESSALGQGMPLGAGLQNCELAWFCHLTWTLSYRNQVCCTVHLDVKRELVFSAQTQKEVQVTLWYCLAGHLLLTCMFMRGNSSSTLLNRPSFWKPHFTLICLLYSSLVVSFAYFVSSKCFINYETPFWDLWPDILSQDWQRVLLTRLSVCVCECFMHICVSVYVWMYVKTLWSAWDGARAFARGRPEADSENFYVCRVGGAGGRSLHATPISRLSISYDTLWRSKLGGKFNHFHTRRSTNAPNTHLNKINA